MYSLSKACDGEMKMSKEKGNQELKEEIELLDDMLSTLVELFEQKGILKH